MAIPRRRGGARASPRQAGVTTPVAMAYRSPSRRQAARPVRAGAAGAPSRPVRGAERAGRKEGGRPAATPMRINLDLALVQRYPPVQLERIVRQCEDLGYRAFRYGNEKYFRDPWIG